jgi:hypothetical protein
MNIVDGSESKSSVASIQAVLKRFVAVAEIDCRAELEAVAVQYPTSIENLATKWEIALKVLNPARMKALPELGYDETPQGMKALAADMTACFRSNPSHRFKFPSPMASAAKIVYSIQGDNVNILPDDVMLRVLQRFIAQLNTNGKKIALEIKANHDDLSVGEKQRKLQGRMVNVTLGCLEAEGLNAVIGWIQFNVSMVSWVSAADPSVVSELVAAHQSTLELL